MIPIFITCFNNYKFVENTIKQIKLINEDYSKNIRIIDNNSTCNDTKFFLQNLINNVIYSEDNIEFYNSLPDNYIIMSPYLEFNKNMPNNFIEILSMISQKYNSKQISISLNVNDINNYYCEITNTELYKNEINSYNNKIINNEFELYKDFINFNSNTKLYLINKKMGENIINIGGEFTANFIPWYKNNKVYNIYENYINNIKLTNINDISNIIKTNIEKEFFLITKKKELLLFENNNNTLWFWKTYFKPWEEETFSIFDKFLNKNKIFIDIGAWIGTTCMYGSRISKYVYAVEADIKSYEDLKINCKVNCENNLTLINNAIYNIDNIDITFGKNKFSLNSNLNDSSSQIYLNSDKLNSDCYTIKTITINTIIEKYNINLNEVSLIKVDIEGGEEFILKDLYDIYNIYKVPLLISFHYSWWYDKNLDRFNFLTNLQKEEIISNPFTSLLFE